MAELLPAAACRRELVELGRPEWQVLFCAAEIEWLDTRFGASGIVAATSNVERTTLTSVR